MVVLPADHLITDEAGFREVIRAAAVGSRPGRPSGSRPRSSPSASGSTGRRPSSATSSPTSPRGRSSTASRPTPWSASRRSRTRTGRVVLQGQPGVAWNAGMFLWQRGAIRAALERFAPDILVTVEAGLVGDRLAEAYDAVRATSIDYAVMEPAARAGLVAMGAMDVGWSDLGQLDRPARRDRGGRHRSGRPGRGGGDGRSGRPGDRPRGGSGRPARPARRATRYPRPHAERTARGRPPEPRPDRGPPRASQSTGDETVTNIAEVPTPTRIVFGTDGWRAKVADEYTFENVRRCAAGVARYVVDRGEQARGVVMAYDRRFASEHFAAAAAEVLLAHDIPVAFARSAVPTQMSSYEVVERGAAAGVVITASHNPWTDNGFKVKAPTGSAAGAGHPRASSRPRSPATAGRRSSAGRSPMPRRPGWWSGSTRSRATSGSSAGPSTSTPSGRPTPRSSSSRCGAPAPAGSRGSWPVGGSGSTRSTRSATPTSAGSTPSRSGRTSTRRWGCSPAGGYDLGLLLDGDADRAGAADERGTFIHQLEVTGLLMYYLAEHRGWRDPVVISVNNTAMAERLGEHYGIARLRDLGRLQVHRPEDDRDRGDDGRRGVGRLRLRDAPARARRGLRRPAPARPLPPRAGRRALAGLEGDRGLPRAGRAVVLSPGGRPRRSGRLPGTQGPSPGRPADPRPGRAGRRAGGPDRHARRRTTASSSS